MMPSLLVAFAVVYMGGAQTADEVILACDFEDAAWWNAWGLKGQPTNTDLIDGASAFTGRGKSLRVVIPRGTNTGANFHFKFGQQLGHEPESMYFRYYLKLDPDWKKASDGGKLPGFSGTYGKSGWGGRKVRQRRLVRTGALSSAGWRLH
jgi:hypothetical protein